MVEEDWRRRRRKKHTQKLVVTQPASTFDAQFDPLLVSCSVRSVCNDATNNLPRSHVVAHANGSKLKLLESGWVTCKIWKWCRSRNTESRGTATLTAEKTCSQVGLESWMLKACQLGPTRRIGNVGRRGLLGWREQKHSSMWVSSCAVSGRMAPGCARMFSFSAERFSTEWRCEQVWFIGLLPRVSCATFRISTFSGRVVVFFSVFSGGLLGHSRGDACHWRARTGCVCHTSMATRPQSSKPVQHMLTRWRHLAVNMQERHADVCTKCVT